MATTDTDSQEKRLATQRCIAALEHACRCRDAICHLSSCQKMKRFVSHVKTCKRKGSCKICKLLITLNSDHSKNCQETKCPLPFCLNLKLKQQRMEQAENLKRSIAAIMQNLGLTESINHTSRGSSSNPTNQPSPYTKHRVPQPGVGMKNRYCTIPNGSARGAKKIPQGMFNPGISASFAIRQKRTVRVLQYLVAALKSPKFSQQKRQQAMHVLKGNPHLMATFIKLISGQRQQNIQPRQPLVSRPQPQLMVPKPNPSGSAPMEIPQGVAYPGTSASSAMQQRSNTQVLLQFLAFVKSQNYFQREPGQPLESNPNPSGSGPMEIPQGVSFPGTSASSAMQRRSNAQVLQQLLTYLKSPGSSQQKKQQVLQILKANPQIMAAFIKHGPGQPRQ